MIRENNAERMEAVLVLRVVRGRAQCSSSCRCACNSTRGRRVGISEAHQLMTCCSPSHEMELLEPEEVAGSRIASTTGSIESQGRVGEGTADKNADPAPRKPQQLSCAVCSHRGGCIGEGCSDDERPDLHAGFHSMSARGIGCNHCLDVISQ